MVSVFFGPISFALSRAFETGFVASASIATDFEVILSLIFGVVLLLVWVKLLARGPGYSVPYLPVTGWAFLGAYFCVLIVFTHTT